LALKPIAYDLAAARALLDSAGWTDTNGDGVREHDGQSLSFELLVPSQSPTRIKLSELIHAALQSVGANVKVQPLDGPTALGPRLGSRDFDAWMGQWAPNPGLQGMRQTWASRGEQNYQGYSSPAFDALTDSALTTFDAARSRAYWTRAFQQAIDDVPSVWLFEERTLLALHKRLRIAPLRADAWYANLADWSVDPTKRIDRDRVGGAR
jgi:peptide/nickel transport system substrate-binding protein